MASAQPKVLLMGPHGGGKTSMRSVIFANYLARDTPKLGATVDVLRSQVRLLGSFTVNMWDCGMQVNYMKEYLTKSRQHTFSHVAALIYVCDATVLHRATEEGTTAADIDDLRAVLAAVQELSPAAKVFILVHKADLLRNRDEALTPLIEDVRQKLQNADDTSSPLDIEFFATTIWDDSIFNAWSQILQRLVPHVTKLLHAYLDQCLSGDIMEVTVLESATFLTVCRVSNVQNDDGSSSAARVTNALKGFKMSCSKAKRTVTEFTLVTGGITIIFSRFTPNTAIMVVMSETPPDLARLVAASIGRGLRLFMEAQGPAGVELISTLL